MTKASRKKEPTAQAVPVQEDVFARFATLVATAGVDSDARVLQDGGADDNAPAYRPGCRGPRSG